MSQVCGGDGGDAAGLYRDSGGEVDVAALQSSGHRAPGSAGQSHDITLTSAHAVDYMMFQSR